MNCSRAEEGASLHRNIAVTAALKQREREKDPEKIDWEIQSNEEQSYDNRKQLYCSSSYLPFHPLYTDIITRTSSFQQPRIPLHWIYFDVEMVTGYATNTNQSAPCNCISYRHLNLLLLLSLLLCIQASCRPHI